MGQLNGAVAAATERRGTDRTANLYGIKDSHSALGSRMACEQVGLEFEAHDLFPGLHGLIVRAHGFKAWTVPALEIDGRRIQGTLAISRELDRLAPEAGLFPRDQGRRVAVEEAERFGHDELQAIARRVFRWAGAHDKASRAWVAENVVGVPAPTLAGYVLKPVMMVFGRIISKASDAQVQSDLARLPGLLDHADALIAECTIGVEPPNAADLQILTSIRLLLAHEDLRPLIASRPCGLAAHRLIPDYPRAGADALPAVPATLPTAWLPTATVAPTPQPPLAVGSVQPCNGMVGERLGGPRKRLQEPHVTLSQSTSRGGLDGREDRAYSLDR